ncbi:MAG: Wadjet anti-phage system protein JetA family protein [Verrucomicrobiota bacterium]
MLSADLFSQIRPEFLRLLGSSAAGLYLDAADEVERETALRAGPLARDEALAIVERAVERNGEIEIEDAAAQTVREKARAVLDRLSATGWLMAEDRADYSRFVLVEPDAAVLLEALRKIARPGAVVFSDALVGTCNALRNTAALAAEPWQTVQKCIQDTRQGERELRAVSKSVERHTRRQLGAQSLRENLSVVFDEYAANVGRGAYAELVRSRLPTRLPEAREAVERLQFDPELLAKMAAELARREGCEHATAMARVRNHLHELSQALDRIVPAADEVDKRTADFTRKSLARFRYLQEVTGEHRATVQAFFEKLNAHFGGRRVVDAEAEITGLPALLVTDIKLPAGLESLYTPRLRHALGEVEALDDEVGADALERTQRQLAATLRDSLTVARANRFATDAFEKLGSPVSSRDLLTSNAEKDWRVSKDELSHVVACLLHVGARDARYRIQLERELDLDTPEMPGRDKRTLEAVLGDVRVERFSLVKQ